MTLKSTNQCAPNIPRGFSNMADIDIYQDDSDDNVDDAYGFEEGIGDNDESLTPLQRLERYMESDNIFNRQMVARSMLETLRAVGEDQENCSAVLDAMARLSQDTEPSVRSELMEQVPHIAVYCQENKGLFTDAMPVYILPMVVRYLNDANNQVRKTSQAALLVLLEQELVEKEDIEQQVVSVILELASPSSHDDYRTEAVAKNILCAEPSELLGCVVAIHITAALVSLVRGLTSNVTSALLMSKMAPLLGRDITERMFLPRFCEMLTDPLFHVRKVCASNFGEVCNVVGVQNSEEILLPKFYNLCGDGVWGVRKACAERFMTISCACSLETRRQYLANLFVDLLSDQSRWVRMSAFQQLGPFISTFADPRTTGLYVTEDGSVVLQDGGEAFETCGGEGAASEEPGDGVFAEDGQGQESALQPSQEMDIELSDPEDEGAGEGLSEGKLVFPLGDEEVSVEERRAEHQWKQSQLQQEEGEVEKCEENSGGTAEEKSGNTAEEDPSQSVEAGLSSLSIGEAEESRTEQWVGACSQGAGGDSSPSCDKCVDLTHSNSHDLDTASIVSLASSETPSDVTVPSQSPDVDASSGSTSCSVTSTDKRVHVHLDNSNFNTFQYWRSPLPEVDIDFDVINGAPANIHVVAKVKDEEKHKVYSTHVDVVMSSDENSPASLPGLSEGSLHREVDLPGVKIHTASVSTVSDTGETVRNFGSTNVLGDGLGECTLAVVDGVVKDLSSSSIEYMDGDYLPPKDRDDAYLAQQQDIIPQSLLENFLGMVDPSRAQTVDGEITRHCAYNLPAVAYTLGRRNWHCIKHLYETLAQAMQWKVRRTLAFSIHEMAMIEGEEITHRDLLPVFDGFIKDLDEVRIGVLKHLSDFLKLLRPEVRQQYLSKMGDFMKTDNHRNWRFRQELAEQLILLCELFDPRSILRHIAPLSVTLCMDKVAEVRNVSFGLMSAVLRRVHEENEDKLLQMICVDLQDKFASSNRWLGRQIYSQLCQNVLEENALPPALFAEHMLAALLALRNDPIPNVRLTLARVLAQRIVPLDYFTSSQNPYHEELIATLQSLQADKDRDVRYFSCQHSASHSLTGLPHAFDFDTVPV